MGGRDGGRKRGRYEAREHIDGMTGEEDDDGAEVERAAAAVVRLWD